MNVLRSVQRYKSLQLEVYMYCAPFSMLANSSKAFICYINIIIAQDHRRQLHASFVVNAKFCE